MLRPPVRQNDAVSPLFQDGKEATEETVYNSLFTAQTTIGYRGRKVEAIPVDKGLEICRRHAVLQEAK